MRDFTERMRMLQALFAATALLLAALASRGQDDEIDEDDHFERLRQITSGEYLRHQPQVRRSDVRFFARMAGLTSGQRDAALDLFEAYSARHEASARKMQEYEDSLTGGDDQRLWNDPKIEPALKPVREDFFKHQQKLKSELLEDMKTVLTDDQQGKWEWFERRLSWSGSTWQVSIFGGAQPDLASIAHRVAGDQAFSEEVVDVLSRYYSDSFALMKEAAGAQAAHRAGIGALQNHEEHWAEMEAVLLEYRQRNLALTQRTASKLQGLLTEPLGARFEEAYLKELTRSLDAMGSMIRSDRAFAAVRRVKDLSDDQRARIEEMEAAERRAEVARMRGVLEARLQKPLGWQRDNMQEEQLAAVTQYQQRLLENRALIARLREVLTPEQQDLAGPPISVSDIYIPNFDAEDMPAPPMKPSGPGFPDIEGMLDRPVMTELDLAFLRREASLGDDQHSSAKDLFDAYRARARLASRKIAAFQQSMSERMLKGDPGDMLEKRSMRVFSQFQKYNERIRDELVEDLRSLLTEEQSPAFESIERRIKRRSLSMENVSFGIVGANVDLTSLTEGVFGIEGPPQDVRDILARWESDLAPTIGRLSAFQRVQTRRFEAMAEGAGAINFADMVGLQESMQKDARKMVIEARDRTLKCFRELVPRIPEDLRPEFEEAYYSAAFNANMWARMEQGARRPRDLLAEARALGDLTPVQEESLATVARRFASETAAVQRESFETRLKNESPDQSVMERALSMNYSEDYQRQQELRKSREEIVDSMLALLTDEQRSRLSRPFRPRGSVVRPNFDED